MRINKLEHFLNGIRSNDRSHSQLFDFMLRSGSYNTFRTGIDLLDVPLTRARFLKKDFTEENFAQKRAFYLNYLT